MKISKRKSDLVLEPESGDDCFTCGVIVGLDRAGSVAFDNSGVLSVVVSDRTLMSVLCGGKNYLQTETVLGKDGRK